MKKFSSRGYLTRILNWVVKYYFKNITGYCAVMLCGLFIQKKCKKVFVLSRFENKKYQEIANELGISVKAVEAHISKALQTLRNKLKSSNLLSLFLMSCFLNL